MKISVVSIENQGDREKEVVTFAVEQECDLHSYLVANATFAPDDHITKMFQDTYWFPSRKVKEGDYVLLFSRNGEDTEQKNNLGSTSHILFWGAPDAVWHEKDTEIALFELSGWSLEKTRTFVRLV
ncbi:MAG: hypothetical protein VW362_09320 [Candidatus Nanopelagicales bacterium]|jgi:hypothetical protein